MFTLYFRTRGRFTRQGRSAEDYVYMAEDDSLQDYDKTYFVLNSIEKRKGKYLS